MKISIISKHLSLAAAVTAANLDLSYNPQIAAQAIRNTDSPCRRSQEYGIGATISAYVVKIEGEEAPVVITVYPVEGMRFAGRFEPFSSCLSDGPMSVYRIDEAAGLIHPTTIKFPKTKAGRELLALLCAAAPEAIALAL